MRTTPNADRVHISFFGRTNAGKSALINAITRQAVSIVSQVPGTTTDTVSKAMELLPLGPVVLTDTAGYEDTSELGKVRIAATQQALLRSDLAVFVIPATSGITEEDQAWMDKAKSRNIPVITVYSQADQVTDRREGRLYVSAQTGEGIEALKEILAKALPQKRETPLIMDKVSDQGAIILVTPIDLSAPKGRIILPQQQVLREVLDAHRVALVCQPDQLAETLNDLKTPPACVITDSQAFGKVSQILDQSIPLTSFSILMARRKGFLESAVRGARVLDRLQDGNQILIAEGCTHHRSCEDIGTVKLPKLIRQKTGKDLAIDFSTGKDFPQDLSPYRLVIHCGACMLTEKDMALRSESAQDQLVPLTNYGTALAHLNGILQRSIELFPEYSV